MVLYALPDNSSSEQFLAALGLTAYVGQPLILAALHLGQLHIGADDGHGRFQLVPGVGDELLLLLVALGHGADYAARQDQQQREHREQTQQRERDARQKRGAE